MWDADIFYFKKLKCWTICAVIGVHRLLLITTSVATTPSDPTSLNQLNLSGTAMANIVLKTVCKIIELNNVQC